MYRVQKRKKNKFGTKNNWKKTKESKERRCLIKNSNQTLTGIWWWCTGRPGRMSCCCCYGGKTRRSMLPLLRLRPLLRNVLTRDPRIIRQNLIWNPVRCLFRRISSVVPRWGRINPWSIRDLRSSIMTNCSRIVRCLIAWLTGLHSIERRLLISVLGLINWRTVTRWNRGRILIISRPSGRQSRHCRLLISICRRSQLIARTLTALTRTIGLTRGRKLILHRLLLYLSLPPWIVITTAILIHLSIIHHTIENNRKI